MSQAQWLQWTSNRNAPLINKAAAGLYAPGSTFKIVVAMAGLESKAITPGDRINCPGYLDLGDTRFHCWKRGGHGLLDLRGGIKNSCDVFFYEVARRTGIDRIAAMANRFGLGVPLEIELPGARSGLIPTREWRIAQGKPWNIGDTIVAGIGQGFLQVTPLSLAVMAARIATGRAVQPHLTLAVGGVEQPGDNAAAWPSLGLPEPRPERRARGHVGGGERAGRHGADRETAAAGRADGRQDRLLAGAPGVPRAAGARVQVRDAAVGVPAARAVRGVRADDRPRYACAVVVEHGNAGAAAAAPVARDIMVDVLTRDPANRRQPPPDRVAQGSPV